MSRSQGSSPFLVSLVASNYSQLQIPIAMAQWNRLHYRIHHPLHRSFEEQKFNWVDLSHSLSLLIQRDWKLYLRSPEIWVLLLQKFEYCLLEKIMGVFYETGRSEMLTLGGNDAAWKHDRFCSRISAKASTGKFTAEIYAKIRIQVGYNSCIFQLHSQLIISSQFSLLWTIAKCKYRSISEQELVCRRLS